jgi:hypothetical protein
VTVSGLIDGTTGTFCCDVFGVIASFEHISIQQALQHAASSLNVDSNILRPRPTDPQHAPAQSRNTNNGPMPPNVRLSLYVFVPITNITTDVAKILPKQSTVVIVMIMVCIKK